MDPSAYCFGLSLAPLPRQEAQLRVQHAAELDAVHARLQEVLARKDEANQQLRAQLDATLAQLQQATRELMGDDE
mgnify:CR=1 FL=1